jgi:ribosome-associated translation inhibitor RaiA
MIKFNICKKVSGQNIKIGKHYSLYCKKKFSEILNKYAVNAVSYSSNIIKRKYYYKVKLKIVLSENADYEATGKAKFPYDALNMAIIHLSKILRRHSRKIKNDNKRNKQIRFLKDSFLLYNLK